MLYFLQMGASKVLTTLPLQIQNSWQLSLLELPLLVTLRFLPGTPPGCIPPLFYLALLLLMQHSRSTLGFKPLIPLLPILSLLPLAPGCPSVPPTSSPPRGSHRVLQWNAGGLRARSTEVLHFLSSHPVNLVCIQESNLNSSSSFRIPGFSTLRSDRTQAGLVDSLS